MKKLIVILFIITIISVLLNSKEQVIIPNTAIRFRIIANSNSKEDQDLKYEIRNEIEPTLIEELYQANNIEEARENISSYIPQIEKTIKKYDTSYDINFGSNYFPEKEYKGVIYPEGEYESLVITLGNGLGDNWWCVLFPPLCLLEGEESDINNTEYKFYVEEILNKFKN